MCVYSQYAPVNFHVSVELLPPVKDLLADRAGQPPPTRHRHEHLPVRLLLVLAQPALLAERLEAVVLVAGVHVGRHGLAVGRDERAGDAERVRREAAESGVMPLNSPERERRWWLLRGELVRRIDVDFALATAEEAWPEVSSLSASSSTT